MVKRSVIQIGHAETLKLTLSRREEGDYIMSKTSIDKK